MPFKPVIFASDALLFFFIAMAGLGLIFALKKPYWQQIGKKLIYQPVAIFSGVILAIYFLTAVCDSLHFVSRLSPNTYSASSKSVLDVLFKPLLDDKEATYSVPWSLHEMTPLWVENAQGQYQPYYEPLKIKGLKNIKLHLLKIGIFAFFLSGLFYAVMLMFCKKKWHFSWRDTHRLIYQGKTLFPYRTLLLAFSSSALFIGLIIGFCFYYHILGTDKIGNDVFYEAIKSIRTGLLMGSLTILFMLPLSIFFGVVAGYFGGWIDDVIQYIYTTISSIPGILLIAAAILSIQVFISTHPHFFSTINQQADLRLIVLCLILGLTGWTGLCRILRAETFKLREMDYVAVAKTLGTSKIKIMMSHILPNVVHLIIISVVLDFSGLVLAEAVLTYVGVGVDPSTLSWGNMIDAARLELARDPVVWWPLVAAFFFMFVFVLALNLLGDAMRNAFDPRA